MPVYAPYSAEKLKASVADLGGSPGSGSSWINILCHISTVASAVSLSPFLLIE